MLFWPFKRSNTSNENKDFKIVEDASPKPISSSPTIGQQFQDFIRNNLPRDFELKLERTKPYILASFIAWPLFWLYRGMEWKTYRQNSRLSMYIQKTYLQAKVMQFSIIMCGLAVASLMEDTRNSTNINPQNER